jgi:hypothetical protein
MRVIISSADNTHLQFHLTFYSAAFTRPAHAPIRTASSWRMRRIIAVLPLIVLAGCLACHSQAGGDLRPAHGVVGEHSQLGVQFLALESGPADALKYLGRGEPGDSFSGTRGRRWSLHTVFRPGLDPFRQSSARSAHAASECSSCRVWPRSTDSGGVSFIPRMAATRRHLSSLHRGDAAAWRRPHSQASTLGSIGGSFA